MGDGKETLFHWAWVHYLTMVVSSVSGFTTYLWNTTESSQPSIGVFTAYLLTNHYSPLMYKPSTGIYLPSRHLFPIYRHTYLPKWPSFTNRIGYQGETWLQLSWDSSTTESSQTSNGAFTTCLLRPTSLHLCTDHLHAFTYQVATCYPYIPT